MNGAWIPFDRGLSPALTGWERLGRRGHHDRPSHGYDDGGRSEVPMGNRGDPRGHYLTERRGGSG